MKKEYGPSQDAEMMRGLTEAAEEMRLNELALTNQDAALLESMGIAAPAKVPGDFRCARCGVSFHDDIWFLILRDGRTVCEKPMHAGVSAMSFTEEDCNFLRALLIVPPDVTSEADDELERVIREPIGTIGRLARILHADGTEARKFCLTQAEAIEWIRQRICPDRGDELVIENAEKPVDRNYQPYPSQMTHADRVFLNDCGVFLHMCGWRDGYYWKAKERRESGQDRREFAELLKQDWLEFDRQHGRVARKR